ncbi:MAG: glycosyltransferase family 2 protein [Bacteroidales bacterium]
MKKVSVVILNWNGAELLRRYLPSVCRNTCSDLADIVVADNGSDDDSLKILREKFPEVKVIAMPVNSGFAEGYNIALKHIQTEYVVLLNSDVEVTPGWLEPMLAYADQNPDVAAIQPKIKACRRRTYFEHAGAAGGYIDSFGFPYCRGRIFDCVEEDRGQYDTIKDVFWATGACLFTRTRDYEAAGGLDPLFFAHMEEIDLCWRFHRLGKRVVCVPEGVVYHLGGATLDTENPRKTYLNFRNNLLMLHKNLPPEKRSKIILQRKLLDGIAALNFLLHGKGKNFTAVLNAHADAKRMIRSYYTPLKNESRPEVISLLPGNNSSIVFDYYMKGKKRFSDLLK